MRYDPTAPPDRAEWLALDEAERVSAIEAHHRRARIRSGNARAHAGIDSAVETQLAEQMPVAVRAFERLMSEGLGRADAIHAMGSAIAEEMFAIIKERRPFDLESYGRRLEGLSAATWSDKGRV